MDAQTHIKQRQRVKQRQRERARAGRRSVLIALESSPTGCTHLWNDTRFSKDILWNQKVRGKPVYLRVDDRNPLKSKHITRSFRRSVHSVGVKPGHPRNAARSAEIDIALRHLQRRAEILRQDVLGRTIRANLPL